MSAVGDSGELGTGDGVIVTAGTGVATTGLGADGDCVTGDTTDGEADGRSARADRDGTGTSRAAVAVGAHIPLTCNPMYSV